MLALLKDCQATFHATLPGMLPPMLELRWDLGPGGLHSWFPWLTGSAPYDDDKGLGWGASILALKEGQCVARQMSRKA